MTSAYGHDFWLQPQMFEIETDEAVRVDTLIGHPEDRSRWPLAPERVISLRTFGPDRITDQVPYYDTQANHLTVRIAEDGLHWLAIETQDSISELEAETFQDYISDEGLTAIEIDRLQSEARDTPGIERYSRRGKSLLAVGDWQTVGSSQITRPLGLTLEIIPQLNPLGVEAGEELPLEVRYRGKVLPGAQIRIVRLDETVASDTVTTGANGLATVDMPEEGAWMYHVIWGTPLPDSYDQDYDTIFSSLTFEVAQE